MTLENINKEDGLLLVRLAAGFDLDEFSTARAMRIGGEIEATGIDGKQFFKIMNKLYPADMLALVQEEK